MDRVVLAHIKPQSRLALGSHGRRKVTGEMKEVCVEPGHRRAGRWMRANGIVGERTGKWQAGGGA